MVIGWPLSGTSPKGLRYHCLLHGMEPGEGRLRAVYKGRVHTGARPGDDRWHPSHLLLPHSRMAPALEGTFWRAPEPRLI